MASWERSIAHKTWVEVSINTPCFSGDLYAASSEARTQYYKHKGQVPDSDDAFEILTGDDKITIRFETTEKRVAQLNDTIQADQLRRATELLAAIATDCVGNKSGYCTVHSRYDANDNCYHALARDFLTNLEENPYA
jgi:hypothetical protein